MVEKLSSEYSLLQICSSLGLSRSTYYYKERARTDDGELKKAIEKIAVQFPKHGYRMTAGQLRNLGWKVTDYKVSNVMKEMGLLQKKRRRKCRTTNSEHEYWRYPNLVQGMTIKEIDEVWCTDITYIRLEEVFVYLAVVMDITTRAIRGWDLSRNIDHYLTLEALKKALKTKRKPKIHHSDQGVQYSCTEYTDLLKKNGIQISMAEVGKAWQNGYCERLIRTLKEDEIHIADYEDFRDAYENIENFIEEVYMKKRVHSSLGYLPPAEFEKKCIIEGVSEFVYK